MIGELTPYAVYQTSASPWLGEMPAHWQMRPAFGAYSPIQERNTGMRETTVLSLSYGRIIVKPVERLRGLVPESFETYQIVNPGDIVVRTTDLQNDQTSLRVGIVRDRGIITSAYLALRTAKDVLPAYGYQLLNVWDGTKAIYGYGSGLRQNLDFSHFKRMPVPVPPLEEQAAIVRFLDWASGRLERAIRGKRKVIALLDEQKQAIIHRAVTRGLDPSVPLKPSGVPWLGDIPRHWRVWRLKFAAEKIVDCLHATPRYTDAGAHPAIRTADIAPGVVNVKKAKRISSEDYERWTERLQPRVGDVLYSREGERFGIAACVPSDTRLCISQRMMIFRIDARHCDRFVMWALNGRSTYGQALQDVMGATAPHVNISTIRNYVLALPELHEQREIVDHMEAQLLPIEVTASRLQKEIDLLREYRTRLVADVVTGKLDTRQAAVQLPNVAADEGAAERDDNLGEAELDDEETPA